MLTNINYNINILINFRELHNLRFNARYNTDGFVEVKNIKCIKKSDKKVKCNI